METAKLLHLGNNTWVMPGRRVRVTRTLVFEGSVEWVAATLQRAWLEKGRPMTLDLAGGQIAEETARLVEVL